MANKSFGFPAIHVSEKDIYFNAHCSALKDARTVLVSKSENKLIFRPSENLDGFKPRKVNGRKYFLITSKIIRNISRIETGYYRLYQMNCGAWYVDINNPLEV